MQKCESLLDPLLNLPHNIYFRNLKAFIDLYASIIPKLNTLDYY